ncbi:MAG: hypothetical protein GYA62_15330 [Bacteroidales bacterium]|nr:hypothetical protein [Bacteroidales bacterium]
MNYIDNYLDELENAVSSNNFESFEVMQSLENLTQAQIESFKLQNPVLFNQVLNRFRQTGRPIPKNIVIAGNVEAAKLAAQIDLKFTMFDTPIVNPEPAGIVNVILFNTIGFFENYAGISNNGLNGNYNLNPIQQRVEIAYPLPNNPLTFINAALTCNQRAYTSVLLAMLTDKIESFKIRLNAPRGIADQIFQSNFESIKRSTFGKTDRDSIPVSSQFSPAQFQPNILDIDAKLKFNKEEGMLMQLPYFGGGGGGTIAGYELTMSFFINDFSKLT